MSNDAATIVTISKSISSLVKLIFSEVKLAIVTMISRRSEGGEGGLAREVHVVAQENG